MTQENQPSEAIGTLQELGLQEYEARCFLALTQLTEGTAKEIHEVSDVPRTRVYDAIRVLESQGLVEVHHSSPQYFRAVGVEEATAILRKKYESRVDDLETQLARAESRNVGPTDDEFQEVWSLTGHEAIESRTLELVEDAKSEVALLVVDESILSETLFDELHDAVDRDLAMLLGGETEAITARIGEELPNVRVFETGLDWLTGAPANGAPADSQVAISRILLVDRETLLIGSYSPDVESDPPREQAVFARGLENGVVVLLRRLVSTGLANANDPGR